MVIKVRDITLCHPRLQALANTLISECKVQGLIIKIGETLRTVAEQDALYAQGRTEPGNIVTNAPGYSYSSYHQWGTAFDFFRNDGRGAYYDNDGFFFKGWKNRNIIRVRMGRQLEKFSRQASFSVTRLGEQHFWY